jgi:hypothetical protein
VTVSAGCGFRIITERLGLTDNLPISPETASICERYYNSAFRPNSNNYWVVGYFEFPLGWRWLRAPFGSW